MNSRSSIASTRHENVEDGLPRVSYYPAVVVTLLAALVIYAVLVLLFVITLLNTLTQLGRVSAHEPGSSVYTTGACGIISLALLVGVVYFFFAVIKGVRDLGARVYFTRGAVVEQPALSARRVRNWLLLDPEYSGPNLYQATIVTDEQVAASADRSQIVQPRGMRSFPGLGGRRPRSPDDSELRAKLDSEVKPSGYLNPERISASLNSETPTQSIQGDKTPKPHVIFRADFASHVQWRPGEEVIVAHSPYLQHLFYVARLVNGEWEVYRNKALI